MSLVAILMLAFCVSAPAWAGTLAVPTRPALASPSLLPAPSVPDRASLHLAAPFPLLAPSPLPLDLSPGAGVYERRGVGLLVVDLKDSTRLHLVEGNRRAHALIDGALGYAEASTALFEG